MLLLYDMNKRQVLWERNIGIINSQQQQPTVRILENSYVIQGGDRLLVFDKETKRGLFTIIYVGIVLLMSEIYWKNRSF